MKTEQPVILASNESLGNGKAINVCFQGDDIALFRIDDEVFAVSNHCPHQHHSGLHDGMVEGTVVTCPMHGWSFDLRSGNCVNGSGKLKQYSVAVRGGDILLLDHSER